MPPELSTDTFIKFYRGSFVSRLCYTVIKRPSTVTNGGYSLDRQH